MILEIPSDSIASSIPSPMLAQDIGSDVLVGIAADNFSVIDDAAIAREWYILIARRNSVGRPRLRVSGVTGRS
jgi:hypothetical protein